MKLAIGRLATAKSVIVQLFLVLLTFQQLPRASMIPPDVQVSLIRIDPSNGNTTWTVPFDRNLRPYRCEVYTNAIVAFLYPLKSGLVMHETKVFFLDPKTGKSIPPFDTRSFVYDDPLIAHSRHGSHGSVEDERGELKLPDSWRSKGVAGLSWRNAGENQIYFFQGPRLKWTMTLPTGAYNLANWKNVLIFNRSTEQKSVFSGRLYGQPVGNSSPTWSFSLPDDIPDRLIIPPPDVVGMQDRKTRQFSYLVGASNVFAFAVETIFALNPETGKVEWRRSISNDQVIKNNKLKIDFAYLIEGGSALFLASNHNLLRFDLKSKSANKLVLQDLHDNPLPVFGNGGLYCFTEKK